jgi:hypothetical protein
MQACTHTLSLRKAAWLRLVDSHVGHIRRVKPDFFKTNRNDQVHARVVGLLSQNIAGVF